MSRQNELGFVWAVGLIFNSIFGNVKTNDVSNIMLLQQTWRTRRMKMTGEIVANNSVMKMRNRMFVWTLSTFRQNIRDCENFVDVQFFPSCFGSVIANVECTVHSRKYEIPLHVNVSVSVFLESSASGIYVCCQSYAIFKSKSISIEYLSLPEKCYLFRSKMDKLINKILRRHSSLKILDAFT